jgi:hypothetical protein
MTQNFDFNRPYYIWVGRPRSRGVSKSRELDHIKHTKFAALAPSLNAFHYHVGTVCSMLFFVHLALMLPLLALAYAIL